MDIGEVTGRYEPFPAFAGWCEDFDSSLVDEYARFLDQARASATEDTMRAAVQVATRYAAVDTGAIEGLYTTSRGFTRTIAEQTVTWEAALSQHGAHVARSIADALAGYEMVLDFVTGRQSITESWIRQLHEIICASQESYDVITAIGPQRQPMPKGRYKQQPNNPTSSETGRVHHYASLLDTPPEMARFIAELTSPGFEQAHPVRQAAYAHYAFVCVHPFADGNGRVARALASAFLYRSPGVPLVVFADQKDTYIDALEAADDGRGSAFVAFIAERTMDTIDLVRGSLAAASSLSLEESVTALRHDLVGRGGLRHDEYDAANQRIMTLVTERLKEFVAELDLPPAVNFSESFEIPRRPQPPEGYRAAGGSMVEYQLDIQSPLYVHQRGNMCIWSAQPETKGPDFLGTSSAPGPALAVSLRDISPTVTELLRIKIDNWVRAVVSGQLAAFREEVRRAMLARGYRSEE